MKGSRGWLREGFHEESRHFLNLKDKQKFSKRWKSGARGETGLGEQGKHKDRQGLRVEGEVGKNEAGDVGRGKIREALDGLPKSFNFIL